MYLYILLLFVSLFSSYSHSTSLTKCRIGITTRPHSRFSEWSNKYKQEGNKVLSYKIISYHQGYKEAQKQEDKLAKSQGCRSYPGGVNKHTVNKIWYVYKIELSKEVKL